MDDVPASSLALTNCETALSALCVRDVYVRHGEFMPAKTHARALMRTVQLGPAPRAVLFNLLGGKSVAGVVLGCVVSTAMAWAATHRSALGHFRERRAPAVFVTPPKIERAPFTSSEVPTVEPSDLPLVEPTLASVAHTSTLRVETELVEHARGSLANNPELALELSREYERRFPGGQLRSACQVVAIDALLRLNRHDEARAMATARLAADPNGLYAQRLQRLLDSPRP
jgi:hypothetical protein